MSTTVVPVRFAREHPRVVAYSTTRHGGVSTGVFASLNCGFSAGDDPDAVRENRRRALATHGHDLEALTIGGQVHGTAVGVVTAEERGWGGRSPETVWVNRDGLQTSEPNVPIGVTTADCIPVLLHGGAAVAAVHAGWRGTLGGILKVAVLGMCHQRSIHPEDVYVAFGPGICATCFEIREDVAMQASDHPLTGDTLVRKDDEHWTLDLRGHLVRQCLAEGIPAKNIVAESPCSICNNDTFFSYRREGPHSGRTLSVIALTS